MDMIKTNAFTEMSLVEMQTLDGGAWSWKEFGKVTIGGAIAGAAGGAATGVMAGGAGAVPGAAAGAVSGAVTGAAYYLLCGWW